MAHTFFHALPGILKRKLEAVRIIPGITLRVPLAAKAALAAPFIPGAPAFAARSALPLLRTLGKTFFGTFRRGLSTVLLAPPLAGALTVPKFREKAIKFIKPKERFEKGKVFAGALTAPREEGDSAALLKKALAAAGIVGAVVAAPTIIRTVKERIARARGRKGDPGLPGVPAQTFQVLPAQVLPQLQPIGVVQPKAVEEPIKAVAQIPDINIRNVFKPEINVRISHSKRFINQQVLLKAA